jgi:hypothetical protein
MEISNYCTDIDNFDGNTIWGYTDMVNDLMDSGMFDRKLEAAFHLDRALANAGFHRFAKMTSDEWVDMFVAYRLNLPAN